MLPICLNFWKSLKTCHNKIQVSCHNLKTFMNFHYLQKKVYTSQSGSETLHDLVPAYLFSLFYNILSCRLTDFSVCLSIPLFTPFCQSAMLFHPVIWPKCYSFFKAQLQGHLHIKLSPQMAELNLTIPCVPQVCIYQTFSTVLCIH